MLIHHIYIILVYLSYLSIYFFHLFISSFVNIYKNSFFTLLLFTFNYLCVNFLRNLLIYLFTCLHFFLILAQLKAAREEKEKATESNASSSAVIPAVVSPSTEGKYWRRSYVTYLNWLLFFLVFHFFIFIFIFLILHITNSHFYSPSFQSYIYLHFLFSYL